MTPRRFGNVFMYDQTGNGGGDLRDEEFFRTFGGISNGVNHNTTAYDMLPSKFKNFHLLHGKDN